MTRLSVEQEGMLANVKAANAIYTSTLANARARYLLKAEKETAILLTSLDLHVRLALNGGVPRTRIHNEGMGTSDGTTFRASLARTAGVAVATATAPPATLVPVPDPAPVRADVGRVPDAPMAAPEAAYSWDSTAKRLTITLSGQTLMDARQAAHWDDLEGFNDDFDSALFKYIEDTHTGERVEATTNYWVDAPHHKEHPVVKWFDSTNEKAALVWLGFHVQAKDLQ